ncbi:flagellin [Limimaricola cinnabarinus]|uniref:Flagellin n=1 Tax=Limimaricola cinnabarinus TaxID=1125964 RepID=A0A2G1MGP9_9RHOB|nr:flagellin [Limimaricola cinnabarinus]PHP27916.1 flagellar protein [Limimaricola cinnabarinus]
MSSILTNNSAMSALSTLRGINNNLNQTQDRISTGLKVASGKDNAAYFAISETMKGDSGMNKAINEGLTMTKNAVATGRVGAESIADLANQIGERIAFAMEGTEAVRAKVQEEIKEKVAQAKTILDQSSFNGQNMIKAGTKGTPDSYTITTGITRTSATAVSQTTMTVTGLDLEKVYDDLAAINITGATPDMDAQLTAAVTAKSTALDGATSMGVAEKSLGTQQDFLSTLTDTLDSGVGAMVDANMEEEAARLQALQVQQQLASQSLSIANQAPQQILSLFR